MARVSYLALTALTALGGLTALGLVGCGRGEATSNGDEVDASAALTGGSVHARLAGFPALAPMLNESRATHLVGGPTPTTLTRTEPGAFTVAIPTHALGALRLEKSPDFWVEIALAEGSDTTGIVENGTVTYPSVAPASDDFTLVAPHAVEQLRVLRDASAPSTLRWRLTKGPGVATIRAREGRIELVDASGYVHLASAPLFAVDVDGHRRGLTIDVLEDAQGALVTASLDVVGLHHPIVVDPVWSNAATLSTSHLYTPALLSPAGKVLALGSTVESYDPATNTWSGAGTLLTARDAFAAVLFASGPFAGKILVAGGFTGSGNTTSVELYDPVAKTSVAKASLGTARSRFTLTILGSGKVLAAGGATAASAEIYDPSLNTWTPLSMVEVRTEHSAVLLPSGKVLVAGGVASTTAASSIGAELYNPTTNSFTATASMTDGRKAFGSALSGSQFWVFGGEQQTGKPGTQYPIDSVEVFNSTAETWTKPGLMTSKRGAETATLLGSGLVLLAGGDISGASTSASAELYNTTTNTSAVIGAMLATHSFHDAVALADGRVVIVDRTTSEVFGQAANGVTCTYGYECTSGFCTDGVCCAVSTCDHVAGLYCNTPTKKGTACAKLNGTNCSADAQCDSSHCADGVCCNTACAGQCEACTVGTTIGTCLPVTGAPKAGHAACGAGGGDVCSTSACNGSDRTACHPPTTSTPCGVASCTMTAAGGVETEASTCDGAGACLAKTKNCGAYRCAGTACATTCADSTACFTGYYCDAAHTCKPLEGLGTKCSATSPCGSPLTCVDGVCCSSPTCDAGASCSNAGHEGTCTRNKGQTCKLAVECGTNNCADGVCCDSACAGQCEACDVGAAVGTCTPVSGPPHGKRPVCASDPKNVCATASCNGERLSCTGFAGSEVDCRPASCTDGVVTQRAVCDAKGACPASVTSSCNGFICDATGKACMTSCATSNQCVLGFECVAGKCTDKAAKCSDDGASKVDPDGTLTPCAPFACKAGSCVTSCSSSAECSPGKVCSVDVHTCGDAGDGGSSGGCTVAFGERAGSFGFVGLGAIVLGLVGRRRRR